MNTEINTVSDKPTTKIPTFDVLRPRLAHVFSRAPTILRLERSAWYENWRFSLIAGRITRPSSQVRRRRY